jgi:hypothetical protein
MNRSNKVYFNTLNGTFAYSTAIQELGWICTIVWSPDTRFVPRGVSVGVPYS